MLPGDGARESQRDVVACGANTADASRLYASLATQGAAILEEARRDAAALHLRHAAADRDDECGPRPEEPEDDREGSQRKQDLDGRPHDELECARRLLVHAVRRRAKMLEFLREEWPNSDQDMVTEPALEANDLLVACKMRGHIDRATRRG